MNHYPSTRYQPLELLRKLPERNPFIMDDLLSALQPAEDYSAKDIEVLKDLEPVRRRPGMYIGGTDEAAMHHLVTEVLDNAMDEAVAGHASRIEVELAADMTVSIRDNGRGIPVDPHPQYPDKSALEVILTTLHAGGKFSDKVYSTAGGLHGVGVSVVNALSDRLDVEVTRARQAYTQSFTRGAPRGPLQHAGAVSNRRGTLIRFRPDPDVFGSAARFRPDRLYRLARSKAYLFKGVEIRWSCDPSLITGKDATPDNAVIHYPGGLADCLSDLVGDRLLIGNQVFAGDVVGKNDEKVEWAIAWPDDRDDGFLNSYCNTIATPNGGTHETGLRNALLRGIKAFGDMSGQSKRVAKTNAEDIMAGAGIILSVFVRDPQFQGQTKERLVSQETTRLVEQAIRDRFEIWLSGTPETASTLLEAIVERTEERLRRRQQKDVGRKSATRKLRLPGKLTDCARSASDGTELFLVEGDSAGGSAKQARDRDTQAILPLRGKILNVESASTKKRSDNQELMDIALALGCGVRDGYDETALRYEKIIIMTDADVDGAHIACLLMTYFYREFPKLVENGHLYLAMPPLYRISQGSKTLYARDDAHREALIAEEFNGRGKIEVSRFKGLGEMPAVQLRETTMNPDKRNLLKVVVADDRTHLDSTVNTLMGRKAELRFAFLQENARTVEDLDI